MEKNWTCWKESESRFEFSVKTSLENVNLILDEKMKLNFVDLCYVILLFRIASHTVTLKYFILLHIAYPEHLSKVKILLVPKVFTYVAFILCFIR